MHRSRKREEHQGDPYFLDEDIHQRKHRISLPRTPSTSSPLREDFDEITYTRPDRSTAVFDPPTLHSPIAEDFDAPTTTRPTTTVIESPTSPIRPPRASNPALIRRFDEGSRRGASRSRRHGDVLDDYNDYDQYLDETDRVVRQGSSAQDSRMFLERPSNRLFNGPSTGSKESSKPSSKRNMSFRRSPESRNEFMQVENRIIEQDAGKTVEVSSWREQVAREATDNVKMSVYYVTPNDVLEAGQGAFKEIKLEITKEDRDTSSLDCPPMATPEHRPRHVRSGSGSFSEFKPGRTSSPFPFRKTQVTPSTRNLKGRPPPTPPQSTPRSTPPNSSSRSHPSPKGKERATSTSRDTWIDEVPQTIPSTTISVEGIVPSFSSVEAVLEDCEPPLTHIGPVLARLGIVSGAHLRAIVRLREETRDREVREEALRQGITVMEWAVFIDRLLSIV